jgi:hypothetical protein
MNLESRNKQRINQASTDRIERLIQEAERRNLLPPPSFAVGSQGGKIRAVTLGQGETTLDPITNGGIAAGDRVRNRGGLADAMPHVQTRTQSAPVEAGKVKVLCFKDGGLWIGGDRQNPKRIFTIPEGLTLIFEQSHLVNMGDGDKWIVSIVVTDFTRTGIFVLQSGVGIVWEIWMDDPRLNFLSGPRPGRWTKTGLWIILAGDFTNFGFAYQGEVYADLSTSPLSYITGRPEYLDPKAGTAVYSRDVGSEVEIYFWDGAQEYPAQFLDDASQFGTATFLRSTAYFCLTDSGKATITKIALPSGATSTLKTKVFSVPSGYIRLDTSFHP